MTVVVAGHPDYFGTCGGASPDSRSLCQEAPAYC